MSLFSFLHQSEFISQMILQWANEHPYLFTFINIANPILFVAMIIAGLNMVSVARSASRWQRGR